MYGRSDSTKSLATVSKPRLMSQVGTVCGVVLAYISVFSAITAMEVLVWLWNLLCSNDKAVARIWVGCCQVNLEILDDPCCQPYVEAASACDKVDSSWLLQCDRGRRTVRFVRLTLKVVTENHAVFVELLEGYRNDRRMCRVTQEDDDWNRLVTQSQHTLTGMTDRGKVCVHQLCRHPTWEVLAIFPGTLHDHRHTVFYAVSWYNVLEWVWHCAGGCQTPLLGAVVILHTTRCNTQKYYVTLTQCIMFRMDRSINNDYFPIWH